MAKPFVTNDRSIRCSVINYFRLFWILLYVMATDTYSFFLLYSDWCRSICIDFCSLGTFAHFAWIWWGIFSDSFDFWLTQCDIVILISFNGAFVLFSGLTEMANMNLIQWTLNMQTEFYPTCSFKSNSLLP